jgi:hypothetical protein
MKRRSKTKKQILRKYRKHRFSRKGKRYTIKQRGGDFACGEGATRFGTSPDGAKIVCRHNESGEMFVPDDSKDGIY